MKTLTEQIRHAIALAFFASAYADQAEECGQALHGEIMDQLPLIIDSAAIHAAETLSMDLQRKNGTYLDSLFTECESIWIQAGKPGDRPFTAEMFGHYLAMQAMGHGVGLWDPFGDEVYEHVTVPSCEFGSYSLSLDYFQPIDGSDDQ